MYWFAPLKRVISAVLASFLLCTGIFADARITASADAPVTPETAWYSEESTVFTLTTAAELLGFSELAATKTFAGKTVKLGADITVPEGSTWTRILNFRGTFDGQGHTIRGIRIENTSTATSGFGPMTGLFVYTGKDAVIKNLTLAGMNVTGPWGVGTLIGRVEGDTLIENVRVKSDVTVTAAAQYGQIGGLVGRMQPNLKLTIRNCLSEAKLVSTCTSTDVNTNTRVGGLIGHLQAFSSTDPSVPNIPEILISDSAFTGTVQYAEDSTAATVFGGLIGNADNGSTVTIENTVAAPDAYETTGIIGAFIGSAGTTAEKIGITNSAAFTAKALGNRANTHTALKAESTYYLASGRYGKEGTLETVEVTHALQFYALAKLSKLNAFGSTETSYLTIALKADLDLSGFERWPVFGNTVNGGSTPRFYGTIDGGDHTISGMNLLWTSETEPAVFQAIEENSSLFNMVGMVGQLEYQGCVKNLTLSDSLIEADALVIGPVVGRIANGASVSGIHVDRTVKVIGGSYVGGIAGRIGVANQENVAGSVRDSWSEACLSGRRNSAILPDAFGGIVGNTQSRGTVIENCLFSGEMNASGAVAAGIVGRISQGQLLIRNAVSIGFLTGRQTGAILGSFGYADNQGGYYTNAAKIEDLVGFTLTNCYGIGPKLVAGASVSHTPYENQIYENAGSQVSASLFRQMPKTLGEAFALSDGYPRLLRFEGTPEATAVVYISSDASDYVPNVQEDRAYMLRTGVSLPLPDKGDYTKITSLSRANGGAYTITLNYKKTDSEGTALNKSEMQSVFDAYVSSLGYSVPSGRSVTDTDKVEGRTLVFSYEFPVGNIKNSVIRIQSFPTADGQASSTDTFTGLPSFSWSKEMDAGQGSFIRWKSGASAQDYEDYLENLQSAGFTAAYNNGAGLDSGSVLTSVFTKNGQDVIVTYLRKSGVFTVEAGPTAGEVPYRGTGTVPGVDRFSDVVLVTPELDGVKRGGASGNSFVIRLKNGHFLINDGGTPLAVEALLELLADMTPAGETPTIDGWFLTHAHSDHVGAFQSIMNNPDSRNRIRINAVYYSGPSVESYIDTHASDGLTFDAMLPETVKSFRTETGQSAAAYRPHTGERYTFYGGVTVDILVSQEFIPKDEALGASYSEGKTLKRTSDLNDTSLWTLTTIGDQTLLIGGDGDLGESTFMEWTYSDAYRNVDMMGALHHLYNLRSHFKLTSKTDLLFHMNTLILTCYDPDTDPEYSKGLEWAANSTGYQDSEYRTLLGDTEEHFSYSEGTRVYPFPYTVGRSKTYAEWKAEEESAFQSRSLTLNESLALNLKMNPEKVNVGDAVEIRIGTEEVRRTSLDTSSISGGVTFTDIGPQYLSERITATLYRGETVLAVKTFTITEYLRECRETADEELKDLIDALFLYGNEAQQYFGVLRKEDLTEGITLTSVDPVPGAFDDSNRAGEHVTFMSANVIHACQNQLRFRFRAASLEGVAIRINGNEVTPVLDLPGYYYVYSGGLKPTEYADGFTVEAFVNGSNEASVTYSLNTYAYRLWIKENPSNNMQSFAKALYNYGYYAKQYTSP